MAKKVVVLGGSSGIGKAVAERFAYEGHNVLLAAPEEEKLEILKASLAGTGHIFQAADVTSGSDMLKLQEAVKNRWGAFDILVNSVGISQNIPLLECDFAVWNRCLEVMLYGAVNAIRALIPLMNDGGRIIHITSIHHERVAEGSSGYGMAKAAITQLTRSLAVELAPRNILANAVAPGFVDTPMSVKANGQNELQSKWFKDNYETYGHLPLKRAAQPQEIAGVVYFLAGPDASYITGSVITVDGGLTITF